MWSLFLVDVVVVLNDRVVLTEMLLTLNCLYSYSMRGEFSLRVVVVREINDEVFVVVVVVGWGSVKL